MDFSDADRNTNELTIQGVTTQSPDRHCNEAMLRKLEAWTKRKAIHEASAHIFEMDQALGFSISYKGVASSYFPNKQKNWLSESLIRGALYENGVCTLTDTTPLVHAVQYRVQAIDGTEHLLVCPFLTQAGNIAGITVVCVNHYLR